jgi:pimeloyl-ACP methyl ester carboxylesterase
MPSTTPQPTIESVQCLHPGGLHRMGYTEWGPRESADVVVCVHGLTRNGRDFDTLAAAFGERHRVVCPDIVGRGRSDWLADPSGYGFPQYVADCITLIARLDVHQVSWVGTSMGGVIGMMIAALSDSPIKRMVVNDVGPVIGRAGIERIGKGVGTRTEFDSFEEGVAYISDVSRMFGPHTPEQWRMLSQHVVLPQADGKWRLHYDQRIGDTVRAYLASAPADDLWPVWDAIQCPTLLLRGAESDLLEPAVAQAMTTRGPRASLITYSGVGHAPTLIQPDQVKDVVDFIGAGSNRS